MQISFRSKYLIKEVVAFTFLWMLVIQIYFQIARWSVRYFMESDGMWDVYQQYYSFSDLLLHSFSFGVLFSLINVLIDRSRLRRLSFGKIILIKTFFYILANSLSDTILVMLNTGPDLEIFLRINQFSNHQVPAVFIFSTICYYVFFILLFNFLYQISKRVGPGVLSSIILGKYHKPRDERLIFMFLDLRNSTGIAERLEHKKYSLFIKDCFSFLTDPLCDTGASVYQYVGDEAVLFWPLKKGIHNLNCFRLFFGFRHILGQRRDYFIENYGIFPEFKAGVDFGEITVTEIGELRRDLAFHGDVLNTAARLEKLCNKLGRDLLISGDLEAELPEMTGFRKVFMEKLKLPGKDNSTKVFAIEQISLTA